MPLIWTFWAGVDTSKQTLVTKQAYQDPTEEAVLEWFLMNPGAVRLKCGRNNSLDS